MSASIFLFSLLGFIVIVVSLLLGSTRTRMIAFTPLALYPPILLLLCLLIKSPAYYEYQLLIVILLIPLGILSPVLGICLLLTSDLKRRQFTYFLICTVSASIPLLVFLLFWVRTMLDG
jgi:ATP/ADP translocase